MTNTLQLGGELSSLAHLEENLAAARIRLFDNQFERLSAIAAGAAA